MNRMLAPWLIAAACLPGCATSPESLRAAARADQIHLQQGVSTVSYRGMNVRCEEGALPGIYTAQKEDDDGIYFFGTERSIWNTNEIIQKKPRLLVGGIYLPRDPGRYPQFFYFFETDVHTIDNVDTFVQNRMNTTLSTPAGTGGAAMGPTLAGHVVGGAVVGALILADVGKITKFPQIEDAAVRQKILDSRRNAPR